jgi:hypothetical protein
MKEESRLSSCGISTRASLVLCFSRNVCFLLFFRYDSLVMIMISMSCVTRGYLALGSPDAKSEPSGSWDSIHVFEATERGRQAHYKLTSTIMLSMVNRGFKSDSEGDKEKGKIEVKRDGETTLSGSMTRQVSLLPCAISRGGRLHRDMGVLILSSFRRSKTNPCKSTHRTLRTLAR